MLTEHQVVALTEDLSAHGLHTGDVGAVVHCYQARDLYEVEFIDEHGRTKCIAVIPASQLMTPNIRSLNA